MNIENLKEEIVLLNYKEISELLKFTTDLRKTMHQDAKVMKKTELDEWEAKALKELHSDLKIKFEYKGEIFEGICVKKNSSTFTVQYLEKDESKIIRRPFNKYRGI